MVSCKKGVCYDGRQGPVRKENHVDNKKIKLTDEALKNVGGGYMMWGRKCKICGGVISNDPNTPDDIRCHCNEDSTQSWVPRPR